MLTYVMEDRGGMPLYEYLYRCIRQDILGGTLVQGEKLPSKRALAEHLQVSVITVEGAYQQLVAEGYVHPRSRRGYFVAQVERLMPPDISIPAVVRPETPVWRVDLRSNQVDESRFPAAIWARLTRQVLAEHRDDFLAPVPHQGLYELRRAIAQDLRAYRGMTVSPEQIVIGAGAEYLYILLAQLLGKGMVFALEDPGYPKIGQVYEKCGVCCRHIPLDQQGMDMECLRASGAGVVHISPTHQYPTGLITSIGRRQELLRWAKERDGFIIEDDYDSEFRFTGRPIPTLQSIDAEGRVVYLNTFSQTISPSMRLGFMVLPPRLLERYRKELDFYACTVPALEQQVLARFLSGGHYEQHLSRMRKEYRGRRMAVLEAFHTSSFAHRITILEQGAGLHFLLRLDARQSEEELRRRGEELGICLSFLSEYAAVPRRYYVNTLVVNYTGLKVEKLEETMQLLEKLFAE